MRSLLNVLLIITLISCNTQDDVGNVNDNFSVDSVSPLKAKIGDTITIYGHNLDNLEYLRFNHDNKVFGGHNTRIEGYRFIARSKEKISVKIPELMHEDISLVIPGDRDFPIDLVGMIPIENPFARIEQIQVLSDEVAYVMDDDNNIYKSTDGFYSWKRLYTAANLFNISSFFFLDENHSWIGQTIKGEGMTIDYSENGGIDYETKFTFLDDVYNNSIRKIQFTSLNNGFFVDSNQNMYVARSNEYENIYERYPQLKSLPFGQVEIWDFNAIEDEVVFLAPNGAPYLIKVENDNILYSEFDTGPLTPIMFDKTGYVQVNSDIYKTTDSGESWNKIKTFRNQYPRIEFLNHAEGMAFVNYSPPVIYSTQNGGISWNEIFIFPENHGAYQTGFTQHNGLVGSYNGRLWKYRKE